MATVDNVEEAIANISTTFREAHFDEETVEIHMKAFNKYEEDMDIQNVLVRAITLPPDDDGTDIILGKTVYHWGYAEFADNRTVEVMHYKPDAPKTDAHHNFLVRHGLNNVLPTYQKYLDVRDSANDEYRTPKNYFVPPPDVKIDEEYLEIVQDMVMDVRKTMNFDKNLLGETRRDCKKYIKARLQEQLDQFHYTGRHYHLSRADFWRKLKVQHLSLNHKIIMASAQQSWIDGFFLEDMLRSNYAEKIGSI